MNTTSIAAIILLIVGIGVYIGMSNLATQYALEPSGSLAGDVACAPQTAESRPNQPVRFSASGLATGALYHWASDEGRAEVIDGGLEVRFATSGKKTVYLFHSANDRWFRTACQVEIR